jgi:hypothetical protein
MSYEVSNTVVLEHNLTYICCVLNFMQKVQESHKREIVSFLFLVNPSLIPEVDYTSGQWFLL